jgi:serine/threonine protein kinase/formylglycine-generating enzyme required for sulfatase activity
MGMMADLKQAAELLFEEALDLQPDQRAAFLEEACRDAPELRSLVEELLRRNQQLGTFLAHPPFTPKAKGLAAGSALGRYTILEPLGSGGMGVVYRARDEKLERAVAIKILVPGMFTGDEARLRFHKEALALAKLSHTHIAAVYDVGQQDGVDYIVMECVPGESLAAKLKSGPLTLKDATSLILQIAQALEEAHEQGVIHRDLKPANVMVTPKGQVKVLDFGIAKLLAQDTSDMTLTAAGTRGIIGTPLYMSPEQAQGQNVDARTDLWNLGVIYYELLGGRTPFQAESNLAVLRAIVDQAPLPLRQIRPEVSPLAEQIVSRALEKDPTHRYQSASEVVRDASDLLSSLTVTSLPPEKPVTGISRRLYVTATVSVLLAIAAGMWLYHHWSSRQWVRDEAIPQITALLAANKPLAAFLVLDKAREYLPSDPRLKQIAEENSAGVSITSSPSGAKVEIKDYVAPDTPWHSLGVTPIENGLIPKGYFRWKVSKPGTSELVVAPGTDAKMDFALAASQPSPKGMVRVAGGEWKGFIGFVGFLGPYKLPPYDIDQYEITNREYQGFIDSGGYEKKEYWTEQFMQDGRDLSWDEAMAQFRDTTDRPGPSTWVAGHYPQGQADFPVSGVSWFEASAYAAFAGKRLPVMAQWYQAAPPELGPAIVQASNITGSALAPVGAYKGLGPYGTYDMAGNVREWVFNRVGDKLHFILGGSWKSQSYLYSNPEALSPFDRSGTNGFRCVRNIDALPPRSSDPVKPLVRDFASFKPVSDDVFHAYKLLYEYPNSPLHEKVEGVVEDTADWREEKITFDIAYGSGRMAAYLFLPKKVRPPYQTVLFFPSARVLSLGDSRKLGDVKFFDYIIQSGRAVMYPVYQDTYERGVKFYLPNGVLSSELNVDQYKDAARSLDYLATRPDIDSSRLAYLGVSMGSAKGAIIATLLQERLKTAIFLDGGYFLYKPIPGSDQADFASRMKKPVLMVNGRYDFSFPLETSQNPLFAMLGTRTEDKRHVVLDTPHDVTQQRPQLVKVVLDWLDHYLGRVND